MQKLNIRKLAQYWMKASELDYNSAVSIVGNTKEYVNALFLIHLSCEKLLKALYVEQHGKHAPYSHNLLHLASQIEIDEKFIGQLSEINEFNLRCRYPDDNFKIYKQATKAKAKKHLENLEELRKWATLK